MASARDRCGLGMIAAFLSIYLFWGSTYLGIQVAIQAVPPFLMSSVRFLLAGIILYVACRLTKQPRPTLREWGIAVLFGFLLVFAGNAGSTWAVKHLPSGMVALLVASEPLWLVLLAWATRTEGRPPRRVFVGLALGLAGLAILFGSGLDRPGGGLQILAMGLVVLAAFMWALGSVYSVRVRSTASPFMSTATMLIAGGLMYLATSFATGETARFDPARVTWPAAGAVLYLAVFGSVVALSAYVWLLRRCASNRVATYAFVNPVVAVGLGWAFAAESFTIQTALATAAITLSVILLISKQAPSPVTEPVRTTSKSLEPALARP